MANARLIYRDFFTSGDLEGLPAAGKLLFAGMIVFADDAGEIRHNVGLFKGHILHGLDIRPWRILRWLDVLHRRRCLELCFFDESTASWCSVEEVPEGLPDGPERSACGSDAVLVRSRCGIRAVLPRFPCGSASVLERFRCGNPEVVTIWRIKNFARFQRLKRREGKRREDEEKRREASAPLQGAIESPTEEATTSPPEVVDWDVQLRCWNDLAVRYARPQVRSLTEARKGKLRARLREHPELWREVDEALGKAGEFVRSRSWLTLDWILSPGNLAKLLEGNYDRDREKPREEKLAYGMSPRVSGWNHLQGDKFRGK